MANKERLQGLIPGDEVGAALQFYSGKQQDLGCVVVLIAKVLWNLRSGGAYRKRLTTACNTLRHKDDCHDPELLQTLGI